jgi:hypothetical protein
MGSVPILLRSQARGVHESLNNIPRVTATAGYRDEANRSMTPVDHIYSDLPVLFVDDYSEISEQFLREAYGKLAQRRYNLEKLRTRFWQDSIELGIERQA